jgi:UDP-N-acetylmuramyl tripeptide synthase
LGKGHESGQEFAHEVIPFDDREVARQALQGIRQAGT